MTMIYLYYPICCSLFEVDSDVQLVCKYLNAYDKKDDPIHGINRLYRSSSGGLVNSTQNGIDCEVNFSN